MSSSNTILIQGCHSKDYWDEFNMSTDRDHEMKQIEQIFEEGIIRKDQLISFSDLENESDRYNILIMGDLTYGTGNLITARRLRDIMSNMGYNCYLYNVKYCNDANPGEQMRYLDRLAKMLKNKKIHLIFGIHLWRTGRILNMLNDRNNVKLPYCLIVSGTDANIFIEVKIN